MVSKYCYLLELTIRNMNSRSSASPFKRQSLPPDVATAQYGQNEGLPGERRGPWRASHEECPGFRKECQWSPLKQAWVGWVVVGRHTAEAWISERPWLSLTSGKYSCQKEAREKERGAGEKAGKQGGREGEKKEERGTFGPWLYPAPASLHSLRCVRVASLQQTHLWLEQVQMSFHSLTIQRALNITLNSLLKCQGEVFYAWPWSQYPAPWTTVGEKLALGTPRDSWESPRTDHYSLMHQTQLSAPGPDNDS